MTDLSLFAPPRFGKVWNPLGWTDNAVVFGPDVRWTEEDTRDLLQFRPEVFLGYSVRMAAPANADRMRGFQIHKLVVLDIPPEMWTWGYSHAADVVSASILFWGIGKIETWHVHRGEGIWRVGE